MDPAKRREHRLQELTEKLSLTPEQQTQIKAIWDKAEEQGKALRAQGDQLRAQGEDLRAKGKEVMKATHNQVRAVLTPEQQKIFDAMPPPGRGHHGPGHGEGDRPAGPPPADSAPGKP
jgi:Spy/CpxP family protein refolding chaperone